MKRYDYTVEEILTYRRSMKIESDLPVEELHKTLDKAEKYGDTAEDVANYLEQEGIKVLERPSDDMSSPWEMEIEVGDIVELEDE